MKELIQAPEFPCLAARSANKTGQIEFKNYPLMTDPKTAESLLTDLQQFTYTPSKHLFRSFVAGFNEPTASGIQDATVYFYLMMRNLHEQNRLHYEWDTKSSMDTNDPNFAFSLLGRSYFLVYFHPFASVSHRRSPQPMVAFNDSAMFDTLKTAGNYDKLKDKTRQRMDPVPWFLADKGDGNQFLQFSASPNDPEFLGWEKKVREVIIGQQFSR